MKIQTNKLRLALESVKPGLANKAIIEQSDCFIFTNNQVATYNDSVAVSFAFECGIEGAVRAQKLLSLVHSIKDNEIEIREKDNQLLIKGKNFNSGLVIEKEINLPLDFLKFKMDFKKLPSDFIEAIKLCAFSCAPENTIPILSNVHIKQGIVESCDRYRATRAEVSKMKEEFLVPAEAVSGLLRYSFTHYCISQGWINFAKEDGAVFSCRVYEDVYPELDEFFEEKGRPVRLPNELVEVLDKAGIFSSAIDTINCVQIKITPDKCIIRGEDENGNWYEEPVEVKRRGDEIIEFRASPKILKDILKHSNRALISDRAMLFKAKNFKHSVALISKGGDTCNNSN